MALREQVVLFRVLNGFALPVEVTHFLEVAHDRMRDLLHQSRNLVTRDRIDISEPRAITDVCIDAVGAQNMAVYIEIQHRTPALREAYRTRFWIFYTD